MAYPNKEKLILYALAILSSIHQLKAQDVVPYGLYFNNWKIVNPAASGVNESEKFDIYYRTNNIRLEENPSFVLLTYENYLSRLNSGLGLIFENQQIGLGTRVFGKALYNYQINLSKQRKLSIGAELDLLSESFDFSSIRRIDPYDPILISNSPPSNAFDLGFGIAYKQNNLEGGFALKNILESKIRNSKIKYLNSNNVQYLTAYGQYLFEFSIFRISPSISFTTDYDIVTTGINTLFEIRRLVLLGGSFRISNNENFFNVNAGITWQDKIRLMAIAYSFGYEGTGNNYEFSLSIIIDSE